MDRALSICPARGHAVSLTGRCLVWAPATGPRMDVPVHGLAGDLRPGHERNRHALRAGGVCRSFFCERRYVMRNRWWAPAALAAVALIAAACGSTSTASSGGSASSSSSAASSPATASSSALKTATVGGATVLTSAKGFTLYWFVPDTPTTSKCNGSCAACGAPVKGQATAGTGVTGK